MAKKPNLSVVGGPTAKAEPGHNSKMTDDQLQALTRQHAQKRKILIEAEKSAKAARMNLDKTIKADLGEHGLADIKLLEKLESPEGEQEFKEAMERRARVARWAGLAIGSQGSLFDDDRRSLAEKAFEDGKRAGMSGSDMNPPHSPGTEAHTNWAEGWHKGQSVLAAGIKKPPETEIVKGPNSPSPESSGPDDFTVAADGED